jgi:transposase
VPLPARIIEKSLASDRVILDTVLKKYADHLPLYRQSAILERDMGVDSGWRLWSWSLSISEEVPTLGIGTDDYNCAA